MLITWRIKPREKSNIEDRKLKSYVLFIKAWFR